MNHDYSQGVLDGLNSAYNCIRNLSRLERLNEDEKNGVALALIEISDLTSEVLEDV